MAFLEDFFTTAGNKIASDPLSSIASAISLWGGLSGAERAQDAATAAAQANQAAAKQAAEAAAFKPYAVSTGFGTGFFNPETQQAGYQIDPMLEAFRNKMYGSAADVFGGMTLDPTEASQRYMQQQMGLLQPQREAEDIALRQQQLRSGRIGMGLSGEAVGAGAGTGMVNPDQYRRDLARSMADAQMAAQAYQQGQADIDRNIQRASGLFQTGLGIEEQALRPLTLGADIGSRQATSGGAQAQALLSGGQSAAQANLAGAIAAIQAQNQGIQGFGGLWSPKKV